MGLTTIGASSLLHFGVACILILSCINNESGVGVVEGFAATTIEQPPLSKLLEQYSSEISLLKEKAKSSGFSSLLETDGNNDVFFLRYCLEYDGSGLRGDISNGAEQLLKNLEWRSKGEGKAICEAASSAVREALSSSTWNNEPVRQNAPHSSIINNYITSKQIITTTSRMGDLVYCIRAGQIDDIKMMGELSSEEKMKDFFLYCKEVNHIVASLKSLEQNRLVKLITANDLSGTKLLGDSSFRNALSLASKQANNLYPSLSGPTLLLNLPPLLGALVKLFTPLFPAEVRQKLKFEQGPLKNVDDLSLLTRGNDDSSNTERGTFMNDLDELVYSS